tara:strand:- start:748 stop:1011 length:264 start_codon:yes stop_codon:yes gene_type:complete
MDKNVEHVVSQLRDREQRGLSKYGVNTERTDLSTLEWLQHLQEELMDGAVYIERLKGDLSESKEENWRDKFTKKSEPKILWKSEIPK